MTSLRDLTLRQKELVEQAANGTYSLVQRQGLNREANYLVDEFNRITQSVSFNGLSLLDPSLGNVIIQAGTGTNGTLSIGFSDQLQRTTGTGSFQSAATNLTAFDTPMSVTVGDFNGDGKMDVISGEYGSNQTGSVFLGNGDGTFQSRLTLGLIPGASKTVKSADINGDGKLDVIIGAGNPEVEVFLGNGDGTFQSNRTLSLLAGSAGVAISDLNGDGKDDIITADQTSNQVSIFLGNGNGTFRARTTLATGASPRSVQIGDINGDGVLDFVTADATPGQVSIFLGNGDGTFQMRSTISTGSTPRSLSLGDLNGDGRLDLVSADYGGSQISVYFGNGDGSFQTRRSVGAAVSSPAYIVAGDINGDGRSDLIATSPSISQINVYLQNGAATTSSAYLNINTRQGSLDAMLVVDANLSRVESQLGTIGAATSRFGYALNSLQSQSIGYQTAASRISDVDMAEESAKLLSTQILQQASAAILAQANQQPSLALSLLRG